MKSKIPKYIKKIVVDGTNLAFSSRIGKKANIKNLSILLSTLRLMQKENPEIEYEIICDASLKHRISEPKRFNKWIQSGAIKLCPANVEADEYILTLLEKFDSEIMFISNDLFRDHPEVYDLENRIQFGFIYAFDKLILNPIEFHQSIRGKSNITLMENINI